MQNHFCPSATEDGDGGHGFFNSEQAPTVFCDGKAGPLHLASPRFAAQLHDQFMQLTQPGGADRVPFGLQSTRGVDRDASTNRGAAALGERPPLAPPPETKGPTL